MRISAGDGQVSIVWVSQGARGDPAAAGGRVPVPDTRPSAEPGAFERALSARGAGPGSAVGLAQHPPPKGKQSLVIFYCSAAN